MDKLKARLKALRAEGKTLADKETLTTEERARLREILAEVTDITDQIKAAEALADDPAEGEAEPQGQGQTQPQGQGQTEPLGQLAAFADAVGDRIVAALNGSSGQRQAAAAKGQGINRGMQYGGFNINRYPLGEDEPDPDAPVSWAVKAMMQKRYRYALIPLTNLNEQRFKALSEASGSTGGYLVPVQQDQNRFIELLRAKTAVRAAGATIWPMSSSSAEAPSQTGGATAYWPGENAALTASDQAFGQVPLTAKKLTALTKISAEEFEDSDPAIERIVVADLTRVLALAEDLKYLRGDGTGNTPTGLRNISGMTVTQLGAGNGATPTLDNLTDAIYRLDAANAPMEGRAFIVHPRTVNTMRKVKDSQNRYLWSDPAAPGDPPTFWGVPVFMTTQIPINLTVGGSTDCSEIYLGSWPEALIGQRKAIEIRTSDEAGNAFEYDQVFVRAIMRVDFNVRHVESFQIITGVRP